MRLVPGHRGRASILEVSTMSRSYRAGLLILGVLSLVDVFTPLITDGEHPPMFIALIGSALGLISIALVAVAWRGRRLAAIGLVVLRLLSALTAVPAFVVDGVPAIAMLMAGLGIGVTVVGCVLILSGVSQRSLATAR
jgi:hypothetical protein